MDRDSMDWGARIEVVHRKEGRTMTTAVLHVSGAEEPPVEALVAAVTGNSGGAGQAVRRPDENGKQVYWLNVAKLF